jgi:transcription antitermination factor NusA-like protein
VVNCVVKRFENGDIIVDLGKTEGQLGKRDQSRLENFSVGDRLRVIITKVDKTAKGPQVIVSRTAPELVQHLFQTEVPEIYDGTVQIKSIAREAGERTKIAVTSRERDVDPVGACVGMKGTRVQSIIRELRGEKIDIIQWNDDIVTFATNSISPAKLSRVSIVDSNDSINAATAGTGSDSAGNHVASRQTFRAKKPRSRRHRNGGAIISPDPSKHAGYGEKNDRESAMRCRRLHAVTGLSGSMSASPTTYVPQGETGSGNRSEPRGRHYRRNKKVIFFRAV